MKEYEELWLYYMPEFLLTKETFNIKNLKYKMISEIFYILNISSDYCDKNIYDVNIPKVFILSYDKNVYYESDRFNLINYVN